MVTQKWRLSHFLIVCYFNILFSLLSSNFNKPQPKCLNNMFLIYWRIMIMIVFTLIDLVTYCYYQIVIRASSDLVAAMSIMLSLQRQCQKIYAGSDWLQ